MRKIFILSLLFTASLPSFASSLKCASKAADVYYKNIIKTEQALADLRKAQDSRRTIESMGISQVEYYCELGIKNKSINVFEIIESATNRASSGGIGKEAARDFGISAGEMYQYGKQL